MDSKFSRIKNWPQTWQGVRESTQKSKLREERSWQNNGWVISHMCGTSYIHLDTLVSPLHWLFNATFGGSWRQHLDFELVTSHEDFSLTHDWCCVWGKIKLKNFFQRAIPIPNCVGNRTNTSQNRPCVSTTRSSSSFAKKCFCHKLEVSIHISPSASAIWAISIKKMYELDSQGRLYRFTV